MKILAFFRDLFKKFPLLLIGNTALLLLVNLVGVLSLFTIAPVVDHFLNTSAQNVSILTQRVGVLFERIGLPLTLGSFFIVFLLFQVLRNALYLLAKWATLKTWNIVLHVLFAGSFEKFFKARWQFFSTKRQGTLLNTFNREIEIVGQAFRAMAMLLSSFLQLIFYLAVPFYLSWQVASISVFAALIFALPIFYIGKISYRLGKRSTATANEVTHLVHEGIALAKVILGFGNQKKSVDNLSRSLAIHRQFVLWAQTLRDAIPLIYEPLGILVIAIGLFVARKLAVPLSSMAVIFWAMRYTIQALSNIIAHNNALSNFYPSYEQIKNLTTQAEELKQPSGTRSFSGFKKEISIENLSFAYPDHQPVLVDINACIPKGKMVAIVGESGAGKSTFIDIIMGFNEPMKGRVAFDDISLFNFDIYSYRKKIGYVPQDTILFNMSIMDNLLWAKEDATNEEVKNACLLANADEFIERFPHIYNTVVGDRGIRLSGGQRQRIALARAILRKPELLILDEATSSLDTYSERLIQKAIENIAKETTIVVIAHRLSTIVNADYVYVLEKGKIIEEGLYRDLVKMDGFFNHMAKLQLLDAA